MTVPEFSEPVDAQIPHNREAEEAVLGSIIINPDVLAEVRVALPQGAKEFYVHRNQFVWNAIDYLEKQGTPIDFVTLKDRLDDAGRLDEVGADYLMILINQTGTSLNALAYAEIVHKKYQRRQLLNAANEVANLAYRQDMDDDALLAQAARAIGNVGAVNARRMTHITDIITRADREIEARKSQVTPPGVPTGLVDLDKALGGGAQDSDLILVAARPGSGKTSLLTQLLDHAAWYGDAATQQTFKKRVVMYSLEMPESQLALRLISQLSEIPFQMLRAGRIPDDKWNNYYAAISRLSQLDIYIDDTPGITPGYLQSSLEALHKERPVDLVMVDSLNLMKSEVNFGKRTDMVVDYCATEVKNTARRLKLPIWMAHQMNREVERRGQNAKPQLADLAEGGERPCDTVVFIHHERAGEGPDAIIKSSSLIIAKNRNGPTPEIPVFFQSSAFRFESAVKVRL